MKVAVVVWELRTMNVVAAKLDTIITCIKETVSSNGILTLVKFWGYFWGYR
jgi:hypothetical protein